MFIKAISRRQECKRMSGFGVFTTSDSSFLFASSYQAFLFCHASICGNTVEPRVRVAFLQRGQESESASPVRERTRPGRDRVGHGVTFEIVSVCLFRQRAKRRQKVSLPWRAKISGKPQ